MVTVTIQGMNELQGKSATVTFPKSCHIRHVREFARQEMGLHTGTSIPGYFVKWDKLLLDVSAATTAQAPGGCLVFCV